MVNQASQALVTACDCRFDLVMSVYVTEDRWDPDPPFQRLHHRHSRFEVFMYALRSYAPLPLERVYLYVELDKTFEGRRAELRAAAQQLFGNRLITLQPRRLITQKAWREELAATIAPPKGALGKDAAQRLIWFLQNDDHIFVDMNDDVLCEGLARMRADNSRFKTLFMSHWGSSLKLAGKVERPKQRGAYIVSRMTQIDSIQVMNWGYLHYLLDELDWKGKTFKRIDMMLRQPAIYDRPLMKASLAQLRVVKESLQTTYFPMRELARKFDGYEEMRIPHDVRPCPLCKPPVGLPRRARVTYDASCAACRWSTRSSCRRSTTISRCPKPTWSR